MRRSDSAAGSDDTFGAASRGRRCMVEHAGQASLVLDVPCGVGRWVPTLRRLRPELIVEADVSPAMLVQVDPEISTNPSMPFAQVDATALPFHDNAFDLVFCHALTKHLPIPLQAKVLRELSRVSRRYVICSFSINAGVPAIMRRLRRGGQRPIVRCQPRMATGDGRVRWIDNRHEQIVHQPDRARKVHIVRPRKVRLKPRRSTHFLDNRACRADPPKYLGRHDWHVANRPRLDVSVRHGPFGYKRKLPAEGPSAGVCSSTSESGRRQDSRSDTRAPAPSK